MARSPKGQKNLSKLTEEEKGFIVTQNAIFETPSSVAEAFEERFGRPLDRRQAEQYDPTKVTGKRCAKKWKDLFWVTRRKFIEELADIGIANKAYRLKQKQRIYDKAMQMGNIGLANEVLESAAKDHGGMFENRRTIEHTGKDGGPIKTETTVESPADVRRNMSEVLGFDVTGQNETDEGTVH